MALHVGEGMAEALLSDAEEEFTTFERRLRHRMDGYRAVLWSDDYIYARCCVPSAQILSSPDPFDRSLSKRGWEKLMQDWRRHLKKICRES